MQAPVVRKAGARGILCSRCGVFWPADQVESDAPKTVAGSWGGGVVEYDPKVIRKFADTLYARAWTTVIVFTGLGALVGFGLTLPQPPAIQVLVTAILALFGFALGRQAAFSLRLQAQVALCQVMIEDNTRRARREEK